MTSIPEIRPAKRRGLRAARRVVFIAFEGVSSLDVSGPLSVFAGATHFLKTQGLPGYDCSIVTLGGGAVTTDLGTAFVSKPAAELARWTCDTVMIPGSVDMEPALRDKKLIAWIAQRGSKVRRVCSVCAGAHLLAASGLAEGRRLATHWAHCTALQERNPAVKVESDPIYIQDGPIWSSAGVTAGIDLALALVEEDHGRDLAMAVARQHVVFLRRSGGQSQFSTLLQAQVNGMGTFAKLHDWLMGRLGDSRLTVEKLAEHAGMSPRNFSRVYTSTTGRTPAKALELFRLEAARRLLETTQERVEAIAGHTGFGTEERMRITFQRHFKVSPRLYRERFGLSAGKPARSSRSTAR
jgi:transcriptional regulator GlxA family with amidase domain